MADIITLAEFHTYDDSPSPNSTDDQIEAMIDVATKIIEEKTGRVFEIADNPSPNDAVEILNGKGTIRIYTRNAPVTAVSKVEYWDGTAWQEYDSTCYPYSFKTGSNIVYFTEGHVFYKGWQNIRVTFEYGFTSDFPKDLKIACFHIVKYLLLESDTLGVRSQSDGEQSFSYDHALPANALRIIMRYKTDVGN